MFAQAAVRRSLNPNRTAPNLPVARVAVGVALSSLGQL
jgi:hypothetical protein